MRNQHVSNFNRDIFPESSGFQSVHAHTLPGRVRDTREWTGWTWPRFHTTPLLEHPGPQQHQPNYHATLPSNYHHHSGTRPSIFGQLFEPLERDPAEITKHADKWVVKLRSPVFRRSGAKVQVRNGKLVVSAKSSIQSGRAYEDNAYEYSMVLPQGFKATKISAKRKDDVMEVTVPIA
ncbi:hypothetical protein IWW50_001480 [Coemansia erecta]|nr:hypothetical protein IWW50_001480 [Coemansia erecta]